MIIMIVTVMSKCIKSLGLAMVLIHESSYEVLQAPKLLQKVPLQRKG